MLDIIRLLEDKITTELVKVGRLADVKSAQSAITVLRAQVKSTCAHQDTTVKHKSLIQYHAMLAHSIQLTRWGAVVIVSPALPVTIALQELLHLSSA